MADDKVVHLVPVADAADPDCVEKLGNLLEAAKRGEITEFTMLARGSDRVFMASTNVEDIPGLIGQFDILHADLVAKAAQIYKLRPGRN